MKIRIVICLLATALTVACLGGRQENGDIHRLTDVEKRLLEMERQGMRVIRTQEEWDALKAENDSVRRADHSAGSYRWAASLLWHERKYEEALAYTDTALALAGGHPETVASIRFVRANCFRDCGKPTEEQEELRKIIAGGPDDYAHDARERLAECLFEQGLTEEALSVLPDSLSIEGEAIINEMLYNGSWNTPTISHRANDYEYCFFGKVEPRDRRPEIDASTLPPIPGLEYKSCAVFCPKDTCFAKRAVLAVRCPDKKPLLEWASNRAARFEAYCMTNNRSAIPTQGYPVGKSSSDICRRYISNIAKGFGRKRCGGDPDNVNEQFGMLLTDCWRAGRYVTFYEAGWYDWMSSGDTTTESYYSVDVRTGKEASLEDLIDKDSFPKLARLMMEYLKNGGGELWVDGTVLWDNSKAMDILDQRDGCALIREGLIIYYHPYTIGSGADGQFNAVIPYDRLKGMLMPRS